MDKVKENKVDIQVIQRMKDGDEEAFAIIYNAYYHYIYYMALQYFNDEGFAQDIVQETFIKVFKQIHNLNAPETFSVWIKKITYTICHDKYKARKKDSMFYAEEDNELLDTIFENEKAVLPTDEANFNNIKEIIMETLEKMKPEIRVVGYLRFFEELSFEEIADVADISVGTVGSRIARIKRKLQDALKQNGYSTTICCSIVATPFLFNIYQSWSKSLSLTDIPKPIIHTKKSSIAEPQVHHMPITLHQFYPYIAIVGTLLASVLSVQMIKQLSKEQQNIENSITAIHYDKKYTNHPLGLKIETQNNDYDAILIDDVETSFIKENGKHKISIKKDGVLLDQKEVTITNIDRDAPLMIGSKTNDETIIITVFDQGSGMNYESTVLKDGNNSAVRIDKKQGELILDKNVSKDASLEIYDLAGNMTQINIKQLEIIRQIN